MASTKIKKGDKVIITTGKEKGKEGKILVVDRKKDRVIVEGRNLVSKHKKPNKQQQNGGIIKIEGYLHISNVMYLHKGKPTRLGYKVETVEENGKQTVKKVRIAKSTGEVID